MSWISPSYDLISPDGWVESIEMDLGGRSAQGRIRIEEISPNFVGWSIEPSRLFFNLKSTLAQLGLEAHTLAIELEPGHRRAFVQLTFDAYGNLAQQMLLRLVPGAFVGKLFAADHRRVVRTPEYLDRMFGRTDRYGDPLLSFGQGREAQHLLLGQVDGRVVAFLPTYQGAVQYDDQIQGAIPSLARAIQQSAPWSRRLLRLHQHQNQEVDRFVSEQDILLLRTAPLHIRTVFGVVVDALLPPGVRHTSARVLDPTTQASGDIYELYGESTSEVHEIPLEFYTLEPYREHIFFTDRDQLQGVLEDTRSLQRAFATAPTDTTTCAAVFIVKGSQLRHLAPEHWVTAQPSRYSFADMHHTEEHAEQIQGWIEQQAASPFLRAIEEGRITSQGILLSRYLPSPYLKQLLIGDLVQKCLKGLYFQTPSRSCSEFFSADDRALLADLAKFAIPAFWVDPLSQRVLRYVPRTGKDSGMFVPLDKVATFTHAVFCGLYGSNLIEGEAEQELRVLLEGLEELRLGSDHPLLNRHRPLAMVTGGGPGAMEVGNRVAVSLGMLSCANIVDFGHRGPVNEQRINPFVEAKMTYRIDKLVERQAEFELDFPIFLLGGIGTDFELTLEQVRRKTGAGAPTPVLLMGPESYWKGKLSGLWASNLEHGTIAGSEWVSNCFYCVKSAAEGMEIYRRFAEGSLPIGPQGPCYPDGFATLSTLQKSTF